MKEASKGQAYTLPSMDEPDAMVNLLSTIIFTVTGYHEIIGHVVDYTILPTRAGMYQDWQEERRRHSDPN